MTRLLFDDAYVDDLLSGRKTATVRHDLDEDLSPGDRIELHTRIGPFGMATVADVVRTELSDALSVVEDRGYRHNAKDTWTLFKSLYKHYSDADLSLQSEVSVVLLDEIEEREFVELERRDLDEEASGGVLLDPEEAREIADHLADADLDRRNAKDRDPGHTELFEWSKELRGRANDARGE
jgi:hypothetical protein